MSAIFAACLVIIFVAVFFVLLELLHAAQIIIAKDKAEKESK